MPQPWIRFTAMHTRAILAAALFPTLALSGTVAAQIQPYFVVHDDTTRTAWIGLSFFNPPASSGEVVVAEVSPGAPAQQAGIRAGDHIVRWNDRTDVADAIRSTSLQPGDTVRLAVSRPNQQRESLWSVSLVAVPRSPLPQEMQRWLRSVRPDTSRIRAFWPDSLLRHWQDAGQFLWTDSLAVWADSLWLPFARTPARMLHADSARAESLRRALDAVTRQGQLSDSVRARTESIRRSAETLEAMTRQLQRADSVRAEASRAAGMAISLVGSRNGVAGAELTDVSPGLASYFGTDRGALVLRVSPGTPADRAGLQDGDVIVRAGDQSVGTVADLRGVLAARGAGEVEIEFIRSGTRQTTTIETTAAPTQFRWAPPSWRR
jgi:C-terminal processing protease CtpA/Prc